MFRFLGFGMVLTAVCGSSGVAVAVTLDSIFINTSCGWSSNIQNTNPYALQIEVNTSDATIKGIRVVTPAGSIIPTLDLVESSSRNAWQYRSHIEYANLSELQTQYKTGDWRVEFLGDGNAIIDSVSLAYNPVAPTGVPLITYPAIDATDVPLTPTFAWDAIVGTGDALSTQVRPLNKDDTYNTLMNVSATQWTPGPLNPWTAYEFGIGNYTAAGVSIVDGQPQGPILQTEQGASFMYLPVCGNENRVSFTTVPEPAVASLLLLAGMMLFCRRFSRR